MTFILRDFLIEGATDTLAHPDPNDERRKRSYMNAPNRGGIDFAGNHSGQMRDIRFEHLTIQNFTESGLLINGAANITIDNCNFIDNGASVVPGAGLHHNLDLTHLQKCGITNSRFDDSPWGDGIHLSFAQDILIEGSELARNALSGIACNEGSNIRIKGNLLEGNNENGILLYSLMHELKSVYVEGNTLRNNGKYGILAHHIGSLVEHKNVIMDNGYVKRKVELINDKLISDEKK